MDSARAARGNRTGRPFTGDFAGILLYRTLHKFGFASHAGSDDPRDGLKLLGCRVTNAVKCLPPANRPLPLEIRQCNHYLEAELASAPPRAVLALGTIAHLAVLRALGLKPAGWRFAHHAVHVMPAPAGPEGLRRASTIAITEAAIIETRGGLARCSRRCPRYLRLSFPMIRT